MSFNLNPLDMFRPRAKAEKTPQAEARAQSFTPEEARAALTMFIDGPKDKFAGAYLARRSEAQMNALAEGIILHGTPEELTKVIQQLEGGIYVEGRNNRTDMDYLLKFEQVMLNHQKALADKGVRFSPFVPGHLPR